VRIYVTAEEMLVENSVYTEFKTGPCWSTLANTRQDLAGGMRGLNERRLFLRRLMGLRQLFLLGRLVVLSIFEMLFWSKGLVKGILNLLVG
jgi:hypothetical protein